MRKILLGLILICAASASTFAQKYILVENNTDQDRSEIIAIPYSKFSKHFGVDSIFTIKDRHSETVFIHQLEKMGNSWIQNVLIQVEIPAHSKKALFVSKEQSSKFPNKVYARYVPERYDDFAWENDVVAFRVYGKALEGRKDDAMGMDYWAKRTSDLIIDKWYAQNDYHKDHGEGLDYYSVGQTLGAGYLGMFLEDSIQYTKHYRKYQILDSGPLRTTFKLIYDSENIGGNKISLEKIISLDAGQQFNKIVVSLQNTNTDITPIVVGLARRGEPNPAYKSNSFDAFLAYWEPAIQDNGNTGTAVILSQSSLQFITDNPKQFLVKTHIGNNKPLVYYAGAAWNKAGKIRSSDEWYAYIENYVESLKKPLKVKLR